SFARGSSFISALFITTMQAATLRGLPPLAATRGWTASAPNAAWRGAIRRGCRRCSRRTPRWLRADSSPALLCVGGKCLGVTLGDLGRGRGDLRHDLVDLRTGHEVELHLGLANFGDEFL